MNKYFDRSDIVFFKTLAGVSVVAIIFVTFII